jgi:hypothetical protein
MQTRQFDCQIYVPRRGFMRLNLPQEDGPVRVARLDYLTYEDLSDPSFRRLLAALQSLPLPEPAP